jgi:hypothetical protein
MPLLPEFHVTESDGTLRIAWNNRDMAKDGCVTTFLILFWLTWTPITLFVTAWAMVSLFSPPFNIGVYCILSPCGSLFGFVAWYGVLVIPYKLMGRRWGEAIEISPAAITHTRTGWLAPKPRVYPLHRVSDFALGWYQNGPGVSDHVSQVGLYVNWKDNWGGREPHPVGGWLSPELNEQVFEVVRRFVADGGITLNTTVWGESPAERKARLIRETRSAETPVVPLPPEFRVTEADGTLRIEWDNRRVAKHDTSRVIGFATLFLSSGAVLWTYLFVTELIGARGEQSESMDIVGLVFGVVIGIPAWWAFALITAYQRLSGKWVECVEVGRDAVTRSRTGWLAPKPAVYPLAKVEKVALAWYVTDEARTDSSETVSLWIVWAGTDGRSRSELTWWLSDPLKHQFFLTIRDFAVRNDIPLAFDEWGTRPEWAQDDI